MKTFYIQRTSGRVDRIKVWLPWLLLALFVTGLIATNVWPSSKPTLRITFYVLLVAYAANQDLALVAYPELAPRTCWLFIRHQKTPIEGLM